MLENSMYCPSYFGLPSNVYYLNPSSPGGPYHLIAADTNTNTNFESLIKLREKFEKGLEEIEEIKKQLQEKLGKENKNEKVENENEKVENKNENEKIENKNEKVENENENQDFKELISSKTFIYYYNNFVSSLDKIINKINIFSSVDVKHIGLAKIYYAVISLLRKEDIFNNDLQSSNNDCKFENQEVFKFFKSYCLKKFGIKSFSYREEKGFIIEDDIEKYFIIDGYNNCDKQFVVTENEFEFYMFFRKSGLRDELKKVINFDIFKSKKSYKEYLSKNELTNFIMTLVKSDIDLTKKKMIFEKLGIEDYKIEDDYFISKNLIIFKKSLNFTNELFNNIINKNYFYKEDGDFYYGEFYENFDKIVKNKSLEQFKKILLNYSEYFSIPIKNYINDYFKDFILYYTFENTTLKDFLKKRNIILAAEFYFPNDMDSVIIFSSDIFKMKISETSLFVNSRISLIEKLENSVSKLNSEKITISYESFELGDEHKKNIIDTVEFNTKEDIINNFIIPLKKLIKINIEYLLENKF